VKEKVLVSWSGGKDSILSLYEITRELNCEIVLMTTISEEYHRICMHGVRESLLDKQVKSLGYQLEKVFIPSGADMPVCDSIMRNVLDRYVSKGFTSVVHGDIFLEDLKKYREDNLAKIGMKGIFPLWKRSSEELSRRFIDLGFKAVITCVDSASLDKSFAGRIYDKEFVSRLPEGVDVCGENGEFHSFVYDGCLFKEKLYFKTGEVVFRDNRFYFCDLVDQDYLKCEGRVH
jgi:uncharacterized protein (TIGR00290 family)